MLWTKDSDLEMFVTLTDKNGDYIDVTSNRISIEIKVGKTLFRAESDPLGTYVGENGESMSGVFDNCYIAYVDDVAGIMLIIPSETLDFGTVYIRTCIHQVNQHFPDGYRDVWSIWMPCDLAVITEKGFNQ